MTYEDCSQRGFSQAQTARLMGVSRSAVSAYASRHGLAFEKPRQGYKTRHRSEAIREFCEHAGIDASVEARNLPGDVRLFRMQAAVESARSEREGS